MRSRHDRYLLRLWLARWGFAVLVAAAIAVSSVVAMTVSPPTSFPAVALEAMSVYRVEVGAAVFFGLYLATVALALAFQNRGFTEFGRGSVRAQDLTAVSKEDGVSMDLVTEIFDEMQDLRAKLKGGQGVD